MIDQTLLHQVAGFIYDYIFNGKPRDLDGPDYEKLVEYGVARFSDRRKIVANERLALLAASNYFTKKAAWSLQYFLSDGISNSMEPARRIGIEYVGAYLLAAAFRTPTRLSSVFKFWGSNNLGNEKAQLVALEKTDQGFQSIPVDVLSSVGPTYILGRTTSEEAETLSWLEDPQRCVFCFPSKSVGPDLLLVLRLSDEKLLRLVVQFKQINKTNPTSADTEDACRTTDPNQLISVLSATIKEPSKTGASRKNRNRYVLYPIFTGFLPCSQHTTET
jgi:hypothetical protein